MVKIGTLLHRLLPAGWFSSLLVDGIWAGIGSVLAFLPQILSLFLVIALLLAIVWGGSFVMFHVASGLIHLLLLFAIISFVIHLFSGSKTA